MISEKIEREYNLFKFKDVSYSLSTNEEKGESCDIKTKTRINICIHWFRYVIKTTRRRNNSFA
jgi:hypothetical protein